MSYKSIKTILGRKLIIKISNNATFMAKLKLALSQTTDMNIYTKA
jgi:hypothetical protein